MNEYSIYWIKEEVANRYFHKSDILMRFLKEYEANPVRNDLKAQYRYVTRQISFPRIYSHLKKHAPDNITVYSVGKLIYIYRKNQFMLLQVENGILNFRCQNLQEAVMLLFPMLYSSYPNLFVQGKNINDYGWISPITQKNNDRTQVLYSYR
ncbi:sporulation inhibitor of replication protein SirA [Oceanobacillus massiliensis]|uniref:sporulation inhibitor of replication protein SirA n=1 Tax=Oceanobacillus massiliensis TaxID=1465765 RepID=UPI000287DBA8|nr:sporulation inhibitor of replication protein SirA [Oceanobacillus massiliensis]